MFKWAEKQPDETKPNPPPPDPRMRMAKWFVYTHLPAHLQPISRVFYELSVWMMNTIPPGPEATEAMRKLLEAKDCAIRAFVDGQPTALKDPPPGEG
jgi:hypothetical protein